jgi:hypothetical protein
VARQGAAWELAEVQPVSASSRGDRSAGLTWVLPAVPQAAVVAAAAFHLVAEIPVMREEADAVVGWELKFRSLHQHARLGLDGLPHRPSSGNHLARDDPALGAQWAVGWEEARKGVRGPRCRQRDHGLMLAPPEQVVPTDVPRQGLALAERE